MFGHEIVFVDSDPKAGKPFFDGVNYKGKVFIHVRSGQHHIAVTAHEITHQLKQERPDLYDVLKKAITEDKGVLSSYVVDRTNLINKPKAVVQEEFVADTVAERMSEPGFWEKLYRKSPKLVQWLYDAIMDILRKLKFNKKYGTSHYIKDIEKVRDVIDDVMRRYLEEGKSARTLGRFGSKGGGSRGEEGKSSFAQHLLKEAEYRKAVNEQFNRDIKELEEKGKIRKLYLNLGKPGDVLSRFMPFRDIRIGTGKIHKILKEHPYIHLIPNFLNLPSKINNPVAIFRSRTKQNSIVALIVDADKKGNPVITPIHIDI